MRNIPFSKPIRLLMRHYIYAVNLFWTGVTLNNDQFDRSQERHLSVVFAEPHIANLSIPSSPHPRLPQHRHIPNHDLGSFRGLHNEAVHVYPGGDVSASTGAPVPTADRGITAAVKHGVPPAVVDNHF